MNETEINEMELSESRRQVIARLEALHIPYELIEHERVRTIADCAALDTKLHAVTVKNYFLMTRNRKRCCLCIVRPRARFASSDISHQLGSPRLCFADEALLHERLGLCPGSVTPLALMFDEAGAVALAVDRELTKLPRLAFHPCDNRFTVAMASADFFERFLPSTAHAPAFVEIHDFLPETCNRA